MEAMALRKPVIAARIGGLPELVEHGKNGLLFESGNFNDMLEKIEALPPKDSAEYQQMCDTSFAMARQKFDSTDYYNSIINVYQKLMEK
jgi:glycosyltransferase involved in cell wall biosynthesis